ncbi:hypothetical protein TRVL_03801 [Trypanosoma vivax]|nr:hypothetical protein TRVL_03801 [Trypanosoma vivax]
MRGAMNPHTLLALLGRVALELSAADQRKSDRRTVATRKPGLGAGQPRPQPEGRSGPRAPLLPATEGAGNGGARLLSDATEEGAGMRGPRALCQHTARKWVPVGSRLELRAHAEARRHPNPDSNSVFSFHAAAHSTRMALSAQGQETRPRGRRLPPKKGTPRLVRRRVGRMSAHVRATSGCRRVTERTESGENRTRGSGRRGREARMQAHRQRASGARGSCHEARAVGTAARTVSHARVVRFWAHGWPPH